MYESHTTARAGIKEKGGFLLFFGVVKNTTTLSFGTCKKNVEKLIGQLYNPSHFFAWALTYLGLAAGA